LLDSSRYVDIAELQARAKLKFELELQRRFSKNLLPAWLKPEATLLRLTNCLTDT